jgi:hypothetical protein
MAEDKRLAAHVPDSAEETPEDFDPLLAQANRLPASKWGTAPGAQGEHVRPVTDTEDAEGPAREEDEEFGGGIGDPSKLTAD